MAERNPIARGVRQRSPELASDLPSVIERVLDKGILVMGDIRIELLNIELLTIKVRLAVMTIDKAIELGLNPFAIAEPQAAGTPETAIAGTPVNLWRFDHQLKSAPVGSRLQIETPAPAQVRWTADGWRTLQDTPTREIEGRHVAELPTENLPRGTQVAFTFRWPEQDRWEGRNFELEAA